MRRTLLLLIGLTVGAVSWPSAQQPPQQQLPAGASGFISGRVVDAASGKPVPEATVLLNGRTAAMQQQAQAGGGRGAAPAPPPPPPAVLTDSQGRFFFAALTPGMYTVQVQKFGFSPTPFGPIALAESERVLDWRLKLPKYSSLAGTLRDETGDPAVGVDVSLFRRSVVNGRQSWQSVGRNRSDDRGAFRFGNQTAGDFVVCACGRDPIPFDPLLLTTLGSEPLQLMNVAARALSVGADAVSLDSTLRTWAPTFYPNGASLARATRITLASGDDKVGIDMNLTIVRATRVSGTVVGATGPIQAGSIRLIPEADADAGMSLLSLTPMLAQPDGRFDFAPVPPGQYRLVVVHRPGLAGGGPSGSAMAFAGARGQTPPPPGATMSAAAPGAVEPPQWASELINVGENGISGLVVQLNRSVSVSGRLEFVGSAPQPPPNVWNRINFPMTPVNPLDPMAQFSTVSARFAADGTFLVPGAVPGKYAMDVRGVPPFMTLKSMTMGGVDITDLPVVVGDKDLAGIAITFVDTPLASLTITVNGAPGSQGDDGSILVFPSDRRYWTETFAGRRRFRAIAMSAKTVVTTPDVPAGDYLVVVATALEVADWMESGKLDLLSKRASRVTVGDTGKATVEVRR